MDRRLNTIEESLAEIGKASFIADVARDYEELRKATPVHLFIQTCEDIIPLFWETMQGGSKDGKVLSMGTAVLLLIVIDDEEDGKSKEERESCNKWIRAALGYACVTGLYDLDMKKHKAEASNAIRELMRKARE